ncbi:MAG: nucleotide exchange factor GrpE [Herpetosiphon sp.]
MTDYPASLTDRLRRLFGGEPGPAQHHAADLSLAEHLIALDQRLVDVTRHLENLSTAIPSQSDAFVAAMAILEKQVSRAGREQLKANALAETQGTRLTEMLALVRSAEDRRDAELITLREQGTTRETNARLEVMRALLPALDSLDQALQAGEEMLARPAAVVLPTFWDRVLGRTPPPTTDLPLRAAMQSWLAGLHFVRQRLLDVLATANIQPMNAAGQPFDPRLHVVLEAVPATEAVAAGMVVLEVRRGYLLGDRVLRHAEVTVAR